MAIFESRQMSFQRVFIPAAPGFYAVVDDKNTGAKLHLPVIAWLVDHIGAVAVTLDGAEADGTVVIGPDGKKAHR